MSDQNDELIALTASIVSAYVARNNVPIGDLAPGLGVPPPVACPHQVARF